MASNNLDRQRLRDIEDNLTKERELLKQFEDELRLEADPRTKARYQRDIERQKEAINQYQKEYQELKNKLSGNSPSQINDISKGNSSGTPPIPQQSILSNVSAGGNITIGNINQINSGTIPQTNLTSQNSSSQPSTIKIFLASSSELKEEREKFEIFIYRKCKEYKEEGIFLELVIWEDFIDAMSQTRLQDEYNKAITDCDIFVSLFFTKVGKYTEEEFLKAWDTFKVNNKPLIYTYFKDANIKTSEIKEDDILSLVNFKKKLKEKGHYPTQYSSIDSLKNHFSDQLTKLLPKLKESKKKVQLKETNFVDSLVQQVRSRLHDNIQHLHGTMPLWGLDRWVSLGDLFVDVNILELTSSNRRSELDDLWQDFTRNNSDYRSLDRIGLNNQLKRVSGLTVLKQDTNLMVVGKPGSGKTTYLQRIVTECNERKLKANRIPILIKLREFVDDERKRQYNLKQFLSNQWRISNIDIELILNQGLALILLDGLDEIAGEARKQITKEIKRFARSYPQVQIIVTCRTQSQESKFDRFDYVEVADFNEEQVRAFATHWFATVCKNQEERKTKAQEFLSQLFREENKPIRELAITPILLSLTCAVFQQTGKFYSKRSKLYEEGLELLLESWDESRNVVRDKIYQDLSVQRKIELLSYIAVKKFEQEQYVLFEQEELEGYIGEFLGIESRESRNVLKAIESQHGLLIKRARKIWSFSHLTFQEYLVAKYYTSHNLERIEFLVNCLHKEKYYEVFLLSSEIVKDKDHLFLLMMDKKQDLEKALEKDEKLQEFLNLIHQKAESIYQPNSNLMLFSIRKLYFDLALGLEGIINFYENFGSIMAQAGINDFNPLFMDIQLAGELLTIVSPFMSVIRESVPQMIYPELHQEIQRIYHQFSSTIQTKSNLKQLPQDAEWVEPLREVIIKYRQIGHCWNFNNYQKELLKRCFYLNKLFKGSLNKATEANPEIIQRIENTWLLPIAEIEKRKQSNS